MRIGEDVTEKLSIVPAEFFVERHIYPKYACRPCETLTTVPAVASVIDGGLAAPALLAWVMVSKYADHLPLYRLERQAARAGVTLSRSTLADWVGRTGVALEPLWRRLAALLRQGTVLHADETPVQQLDPGRGKTRRAYLWAYRSNALAGELPIVVFDYQPGRGGKYVVEFLGDWQGALTVSYTHLDVYKRPLHAAFLGRVRDRTGVDYKGIAEREFGVGALHRRLVVAGARDRALRVVYPYLARDAVEPLEGVPVAGQPGLDALVAHHFGVLVPTPRQGHDEEPGLEHLAGMAVGDQRSRTEVDLRLFAYGKVEHHGRHRGGGRFATQEAIDGMHAAAVAVPAGQRLADACLLYTSRCV